MSRRPKVPHSGGQYTNGLFTATPAAPGVGDARIAVPMLKQLKRTLLGPSRDPRMAFISRPLPRGLPDEEVIAALEIALAADANPAHLVESLRPALRQVTGRDFEILDRSVQDVTGQFSKTAVMIRDGDVGHWHGYAATAYPLLAPGAEAAEARAAISAADAGEPNPKSPVGKAGWAPPPPRRRER